MVSGGWQYQLEHSFVEFETLVEVQEVLLQILTLSQNGGSREVVSICNRRVSMGVESSVVLDARTLVLVRGKGVCIVLV